MNGNQTIPLIAKAAPALLAGFLVFSALKWIFSGDDTEKKPETTPANPGTENPWKETETAAFRPIPAGILVKPAAVPIPATPAPIIPPLSIPPAAKVSAPVPAAAATTPKFVAQTQPPPIKRKFITRDDIATVFHRGALTLNRTAAVAALNRLGFGKTAAYAALTPDGRFSAWLHFAPDGIITWTE